MASPHVGAWEIVSEIWQGLAIFTDTRHCMVIEEKARRPISEERTEAELAEAYRLMRAEAGTDAISPLGNEWILTQNITVAQGPNAVGRDVRLALDVDGDTFSTQIIRPDSTKEPFFVFRKVSDLGSSPLSGVWEDTTPDWNGLMILTDTQYARISTPKNQKPLQGDQPTTSEAAEALLAMFITQVGAYTVSGSRISHQPIAARNPGRRRGLGGDTLEFVVAGDTMTQRRIIHDVNSAPEPGPEHIWRRVKL